MLSFVLFYANNLLGFNLLFIFRIEANECDF